MASKRLFLVELWLSEENTQDSNSHPVKETTKATDFADSADSD